MPMKKGELGEDLDPIEVRILKLYAEGLFRQEIAAKLYLSEQSIKKYEVRIRRRLGARHTIQAIALASEEHDLLDRRKVQTRYICGCDWKDPRIQTYHSHLVPDGQGSQMLTYKWWDKEGYEVCPVHGKRLMGWATVKRADPPVGVVLPKDKRANIGSPGITDRRDSRDPLGVGEERLADENGHATALSKPRTMVTADDPDQGPVSA